MREETKIASLIVIVKGGKVFKVEVERGKEDGIGGVEESVDRRRFNNSISRSVAGCGGDGSESSSSAVVV